MNIEPIYRVPQKKLANLPNVIARLIKRDRSWYEDPISPRRLLYGLYVYYQNACKEIRQLKKLIAGKDKYISDLTSRINDLKEYEKMVIFEGYSATIVRFSWTCGDGCCSDSWHGYRIYNKHNVCEYEWGYNSGNTYASFESCKREIEEKYGKIPISEDHEET